MYYVFLSIFYFKKKLNSKISLKQIKTILLKKINNIIRMCGIWFVISKTGTINIDPLSLYNSYNTVQPRGPDRSQYLEINTPVQFKIGFHRLAIMDPTVNGSQPFISEFIYKSDIHTVYTCCNGEIYNFKQLGKKHNIEFNSDSDCEIIHKLYLKSGIKAVCSELIGEFAFYIVDVNHSENKVTIHASRDPFGVRPLYYTDSNDILSYSSLLKGICGFAPDVKQFPPGTIKSTVISLVENQIKTTSTTHTYYEYNYPVRDLKIDDIYEGIRTTLTNAVVERLHADRPLGCLLSGGLDSSLVAAIAADHLKKNGQKLRTFCIGMEGATDIKYAQMVADHIGSEHTVVYFTPEEGLNIIEDVIKTLESYDITTIRASVGQYLLAKYISEKTNIKVVLNGDFSDEVSGGYFMFHNAPTAQEFHTECVNLLKEIHLYDVIRVDKSISNFGLEARLPFSDYRYVDHYMSIDPELRRPRPSVILGFKDKPIEKALLREAFEPSKILPDIVLRRYKEAMSDGISELKTSWYQIIQNHISTLITDDEFNTHSVNYKHNKPHTKEALYYRMVFEKIFGDNNSHIVPHFWLHKWSDSTDPSARSLKKYSELGV